MVPYCRPCRHARGLMSGLSLASLIALLLILSAWVLWRTSFGLRLRSSGEAPEAAGHLGVNVIGFATSGSSSAEDLPDLVEGSSRLSPRRITDKADRRPGFIGLATMIFGNWRQRDSRWGCRIWLLGGHQTCRWWINHWAVPFHLLCKCTSWPHLAVATTNAAGNNRHRNISDRAYRVSDC